MEVESVNPNTPVDNVSTSSDGKVEMDATGGPLTFDELDEVLNKKKGKKHDEPKEKKEKAKDLTSDADKGKQEKSEKSDKQEKPAKKPESEDSKEGEKSETEEKPPRKTVKAKFADQDVELDEETLIPVLVNGKEEMWTLKELRADKSGKTAWDQKFTELHKMRKGIGAHEAKLQETAATIKAIFEEQDPDMKIFKMAQVAGLDPVQYRQRFLNDQISLLEKYYSMSEDERIADAAAFEAKYHKHRADTLESRVQQEQAQRELSAKLERLRASHQVSEDEFADRYSHIKQMIDAGQLGQETQLTPELVIETIEKDRLWDAAAEKLDSLELGWDQQARGQKLQKLVDNAHTLGLTAKDVAELVDEVWGSKKAQKVIQEKKKQADEFTHGKKDVPQVSSKKEEVLFFDDL